MVDPCSRSDFPHRYRELERTEQNLQAVTKLTCSVLPHRYWGVVLPPVDSSGRSHFLNTTAVDDPRAWCYINEQPAGSVVYQRMRDYYGPTFELQRGKKSQGYGEEGSYNGQFGFGSLFMNLHIEPQYDPFNLCTPGLFMHNEALGQAQWHPGTCEADIICDTTAPAVSEPCSEGFVCPEATTALTAGNFPCQGGFVCDFGTTPDASLLAPRGQFRMLCPAGYFCLDGTGPNQMFRRVCPPGYFCLAGTFEPLQGKAANDAMLRGLNASTADAFARPSPPKLLPGLKLPVPVSAHDQRCFDAIDSSLQGTSRIMTDALGRQAPVTLALDAELLCARDHKWRAMLDAVGRSQCDCTQQVRLIHAVYRMWSCTDKGYSHEETKAGVVPRCEFWITTDLHPHGAGLTLRDADVSATPAEQRAVWRRVRLGGDPALHGGQNFTDLADRFPPTGIAAAYFRPCDALIDVSVNCSLRRALDVSEPCIAFCSFREYKEFVEAAYLESVDATNAGKLRGSPDRIDPFIFDSKWAIDLLDDVRRYERLDQGDDDPFHLREATLDLVNVASGLTPLGAPGLNPVRFDHCRCQDAFRCPNGTTSDSGAVDIFDCRKSGNEVLKRVSPIRADQLVNATERRILSDLFTRENGIGKLLLRTHQVAVLTMDLRGLAVNFTWDSHFQLSVYADCDPCPPRYVCDFVPQPPTCAYPSLAEQASYGYLCSDCCMCQRKRMPHWLETNTEVFPYNDNKHTIVQVQLTALRDTYLTVVLELLHGLYYGNFKDDLEGVGELYVFTPSRARYSPDDLANRRTFLALLERDDFQDRTLPLNLPAQLVRIMGEPNEFEEAFENDVLIDRPVDLLIGHPGYFAARTLQENTTAALATDDPYSQQAEGQRRLTAGRSGSSASLAGVPAAPFRRRTLGRRLGQIQAHASKRHGRRSLVSQSDLQGVNPTGDFLYQTEVPPGEWMPRSMRPRAQPDIIRDPGFLVEQDSTWWTASDAEEIEYLFLPYLPWFSNCEGYDSHISVAKLMEDHPACVRQPYGSTINVDPYFWNLQFDPVSDTCFDPLWTPPADVRAAAGGQAPGVPMYCYFEENIFSLNPLARWFELDEGSAAFYMTKEPMEPERFEANEATGERWGRTDFLAALRNTERIIAVTVENSPERTLVPRQVAFTLDYYQVDRGYKRLVRAALAFSEHCTVTTLEEELREFGNRGIEPCPPGQYNYTMEVNVRAMNWLDLLNLFEFTADVYLIAFVAIGLVTVGLGALVWAIHRAATRLRVPPVFRFGRIWNAVIPSPTFGVTIASIPVMAAMGFVLIWFVHLGAADPVDYPVPLTFEDIAGSWLDTQVLTLDRILQYKQGRIGAAFAIFGLFMVFGGARTFIPDHHADKFANDDATVEDIDVDNQDEADILTDGVDISDDEVEASEMWTPVDWRRSHMILYSLGQMMMLVVVLEFAYSDTFSENQYVLIITFKLAQVFLELLILGVVGDALQVCPMIVTLQLAEILVTMGAATFTDFVIAYFVEASVMMFERIYLDPNIKSLKAQWPLIMARFNSWRGKNRNLTREQRLAREKEWAKTVEHVKLETHGVEPLLESMVVYSNETVALLISPWLQLLLLACDASPLHKLQITQIPQGFSIRETDLVFYTIFSIVSIPAQMAMDMFLINTQELVHGWKLYEYVAYQKYRFRMRSRRWQMDDEKLDGSISSKLQTVDSMCFSSQFYAMSAFHAWGITMILIGVQVMLRKQYNMFGDIAFGVIFVTMWLLYQVLKLVLRGIADAVGLWQIPRIEGSIDDELAAKLAIGEGDLKDLEQERIELKAMNSEAFRVRFLERNRPWLVQHLLEILTPRTLEVPQLDGDPTRDYVRSVYKRLLALVEDLEVRSDVSTPRADDDPALRAQRKWRDVAPPDKAGRAMLTSWLDKARRVIMFRKAAAPVIAAAGRDHCDACGMPQSDKRTMRAELATDGIADPKAMDRHIASFEKAQDGDESQMTFDAWRAFVRTHAQFVMVCSWCEDAQRKKLAEARRQEKFGANAREDALRRQRERAERDDDDNDEYGDVPLFEPLTVDRKAPAGRALSKWLGAARRRIGGEFPRPRARGEMEAYAQRLREARAARAKRQLQKRRARIYGDNPDAAGAAATDTAKRVAAKLGRIDKSADTADPNPAAAAFRKFGRVSLSPAAKAIALRWWQASRGVRAVREGIQASKRREDLDEVLASMPRDEVWYYTQSRVTEGQELAREGAALARQRDRIEGELAVQVSASAAQVEEEVKKRNGEAADAQRLADEASTAFEKSSRARLDEKLARIEREKTAARLAAAQVDGPREAPADDLAVTASLQGEADAARASHEQGIARFRAKQQVTVDLLKSEAEAIIGKRREDHAHDAGKARQETTMQLRRLEEAWAARASAYVASAKRVIRAKQLDDAARS